MPGLSNVDKNQADWCLEKTSLHYFRPYKYMTSKILGVKVKYIPCIPCIHFILIPFIHLYFTPYRVWRKKDWMAKLLNPWRAPYSHCHIKGSEGSTEGRNVLCLYSYISRYPCVQTRHVHLPSAFTTHSSSSIFSYQVNTLLVH